MFWFPWQEFADVLREFSPKHESIDQAEAAAQELGQVKARLEMEKTELDAKLEAERKGESESRLWKDFFCRYVKHLIFF